VDLKVAKFGFSGSNLFEVVGIGLIVVVVVVVKTSWELWVPALDY
jgi:hypothetical protein